MTLFKTSTHVLQIKASLSRDISCSFFLFIFHLYIYIYIPRIMLARSIKQSMKKGPLHYNRALLRRSNRSIHLPQLPKPPNKYELLIQARGFIQRLKIRVKYPLMKQMRPFTLNDITALFSWVFLGHTVWLVVGTTSFLSFGLWAANSLQFQGSVPYIPHL